MVCLVGAQEEKRCLEKCMFFYIVLVFSNISSRYLMFGVRFAGISCLFFCCVFDPMVCLVDVQEEKRCFEKCMFFYLVLGKM